jgi:hypothetical protein
MTTMRSAAAETLSFCDARISVWWAGSSKTLATGSVAFGVGCLGDE